MQLQSINNVQSCQPLKQEVNAQPLRNIAFKNSGMPVSNDVFSKDNSIDYLSAKYDFACRLAAFYKGKYETLAKDGACLA